MRIKHILIFLTLTILTMAPVTAGMDFFSKYHKNEGTRSVVVQPGQVLGAVRDGKLYLTEKQAVEMALANNLEINLERHSQLLSFWDIEKEKAFYDPFGGFGFNWDRTKSPAASVLEGGTSLTNVLTNYTFAYRQPFKTGTTFEINFLGGRTRTTNFFASIVPAIDTDLSVTVRQNLLRGFGRTPAEYQIEIGLNNYDITEQEFKRKATDIIFQIQQQFRELEYALKDIEVNEKSLELAQTVHEQNLARLEVGSASRLEVVETETEVALRRGELVRSRFRYQRIQDVLIQSITNSEDPRSVAQEVVPESVVTPHDVNAHPFDKLMDLAGELRPELQQAELNTENLKVNLDYSRDQLKPRLDMIAGYQMLGLGGNIIERDYSDGFIDAPIISITPGGLPESLDQLFTGNYYGYVAGLTLELPIGNKAGRVENAKAQIAVRRSEMQHQRLRQQIALEIRDALTQIEMNRARITENEAAVRSAQERLEGEQARFDVGLGTTRQLIEAQRDLLLAASLLVRARADLAISQAILDKASGQTFEHFGIQLGTVLATNIR